jgi:pimeloyl-ACP methyl ester carboxylesterase
MGRDALAFLTATEFSQVHLLGFSIGSFVAQQIALVRPAIAGNIILASSAPAGAASMHGWAPDVIAAIGPPQTSPEAYLEVFVTQSAASRPLEPRVIGNSPGADRVILGLAGRPRGCLVPALGSGVHALQCLLSCLACCHRHGGVRGQR